MKTFQTRLRQRMDELGMTRGDLARVSGVGFHRIATWTRSKPLVPKIDALPSIAIALECSSDYLLGLTPDPTPPAFAAEIRDRLREVNCS